ncbi:hypothetical protein BJV74DRAFT_125649 [Russula compacta]|nr:hypothetical protein BJV74DRAFT_125649 [Russula compacta]
MPSSSYPVRPPFPISSQVHATEPRDPPSNPVAKADKAVHDASDDLKATGALQRSNQTDDPTSVHNTSETTDEEDIYHRAVTDATTIREANKAESSNGEDSNDSDDPVTPRPTLRKCSRQWR